jgi:hypothetical protein
LLWTSGPFASCSVLANTYRYCSLVAFKLLGGSSLLTYWTELTFHTFMAGHCSYRFTYSILPQLFCDTAGLSTLKHKHAHKTIHRLTGLFLCFLQQNAYPQSAYANPAAGASTNYMAQQRCVFLACCPSTVENVVVLMCPPVTPPLHLPPPCDQNK